MGIFACIHLHAAVLPQLHMAGDAIDRTDSDSRRRTEGSATTAAVAVGCSCTARTRKTEPAVALAVDRSYTRTAAAGAETADHACTAMEADGHRRRR